jgi:hypothetical protein
VTGETMRPLLHYYDAEDFEFTRALTDRPIKFSSTGPFSLSRRITDTAAGRAL